MNNTDSLRGLAGRAAGMAEKSIRAGILGEGKSNLSFHALREDDAAACSSHLNVRFSGDLARDIAASSRCKSRACQKLFALADKEPRHD